MDPTYSAVAHMQRVPCVSLNKFTTIRSHQYQKNKPIFNKFTVLYTNLMHFTIHGN